MFSNTILMMGADTREPVTLVEIRKMGLESFGGKDPTVTMVGGGSDTIVEKNGLERKLRT
jgi:hypothetical protein